VSPRPTPLPLTARTRLALLAAVLTLAGCGGGGGSSSTTSSSLAPSTLASNQLIVTVEQEPNVSNQITANMPYVTVDVCDAAGNCSTIDHVLVDTGSYGLRVFASALGANVQLTPMTSTALATSGQPIGECASFVSSSVWGPVRIATIRMGSMSVNQVPIQVLSDPNFASATTPTTTGTTTTSVCGNATSSSSEQQFGAKGVLGIGLFRNDGQSYYTCTSSSCTLVTPPQQVANPVTALASGYNNGVILSMPAVSSVQTSAIGVLTFGLDTQSDNALDGYTVLPTSTSGDITVTMNGTRYPQSFIDSGSNTNFLDLPGVSPDANGFYAPAQPISYPTTLSAGGASYASTITVAAVGTQTLGTAVFPYLAAPSGTTQALDLGLPYFYGKSIAYAVDGATTSHGTGPYYAIH
jgi:uncharacterized ParB-like nuclease family protein